MPNPAATVTVGVDQTYLANSFAQGLKTGINKGLADLNTVGARGLNDAFGKLTGGVRQFDQAMDRANQRVLLFGASAGTVYGVIRIMKELVTSTIAVEKSMVQINSIFGLTSKQLDGFTKSLFQVAVNTSQAFDKVAEAANEFARQGLSAAETAKRTQDAMILTRLAAISTADAVNVLTTAINGFQKEALTSTQITNRLATVDAAFAVSTKDLVAGLERTGSAAADVGISFNQLIGLITTAKQITGRDGSVIAQALNTIFTRINREGTLQALEGLGVQIKDLRGQTLPTLTVLQNFAQVYDGLTGSIRNQAAELVGGVRNLNTLKAVMADLARTNSVFAQTQQVAANATNEAYKRNEALNTSLAATLDRASAINKQIFANVGNVGFSGPVKGFINSGLNSPITDALRDASGQAETVGGQIAETIIKGMGNALIFGLGPVLFKAIGLIMTRTFGNVFADFKMAAGLTTEEQTQKAIQQEIVGLYASGNKELLAQLSTTNTLVERAAVLRSVLSANAVSQGAAISESAVLAGMLSKGGYQPAGMRKAAGGFIPYAAEASAISAGVGGAPAGARPVYLPGFNTGGGGHGIVANTSEFIVPHLAGGSAIFNRDMIKRYGLPPGATPVAAGGFVPNAAGNYIPGSPFSAPEYQRFLKGDLSQPPAVLSQVSQAFDTERQSIAQMAAKTKEDAFRQLEEERKLLNAKQALTSEEIMKGQQTLGVVQKIYEQARVRGQALTESASLLLYGPKATAEQITAGRMSNMRIVSDGGTKASPEMWANYERIRQQNAGFGRAPLTPIPVDLLKNNFVDYSAQANPNLYGPQLPPGGMPASTPTPSWWARTRAGLNSPMGRFGTGLGLSFLGGVVPEGRGGTAGGVIGGALGSGLSLAGAGMQIGGPWGAGAGAVIGGVFGAFKKIETSYEELAKQIETSNAQLRQKFDAANQFFDLQDRIREAKANGAPSSALRALESQRIQALSQTGNDPHLRTLLTSSDPNARALVGELFTTTMGKKALGSNLLSSTQGALDTSSTFGFYGYGGKALRGMAESIAPILANLSPSQQKALASLAHNNSPQALRTVGKMAGLNQDEIGTLTQRTSSHFLTTLNPIGAKQTLNLFEKSIMEALDNVRKNGVSKLTEQLDSMDRSAIDTSEELRKVAAGYEQNVKFLQITGAANQQITRTTQQIALANPILTDIQKLQLTGQFGTQNIVSQMGVTRGATLGAGQAKLIDIMKTAKTDSPEWRKTIANLNAGNIDSLTASLNTDKGRGDLPSPVSAALRDELVKLSAQLKELSFTEKENTRANDESNRLLEEQLRTSRTFGYAFAQRAGDIYKTTQDFTTSVDQHDPRAVIENNAYKMYRSRLDLQRSAGVITEGQAESTDLGFTLTQTSNVQQRQRDAVIAQARAGNPLVTGGSLSSALFGNAQQAGMMGDSKGSLTGGFSAQFAGMKKELMDLSDVGARVGASLESNLGNAFSDFVTGSKSAKDSFRSFVTSLLSDASRAFASKAVQQILGSLLGGFNTGGSVSSTGSNIGLASGGEVPAMLTGGEYVFTPQQAHNIGLSNLRNLNMGTSQRFAGGGIVRGGSGMKDDVGARLSPGSYVVKKSMVQRYGADYLSALAGGAVQHRAAGGGIGGFLGGFGWQGALIGALIGGGVGYLAGGKKGAIGGAILGGIGGGLYQGSSTMTTAGTVNGVTSLGGIAPATLSIGEKALLGLGVAGGAGLLASSLSPSSPGGGTINPADVSINRKNLEAWQQTHTWADNSAGGSPILKISPQGGTYIEGYTNTPATRRWADGGEVGAGMSLNGGSVTPVTTSSSSGPIASSALAPQVNVKIDIHNNGSTSATSSSTGGGNGAFQGDFANKLQKTVQGMVQQELVNQSRPDGFFAQKSRYIQR